MSLLENSKTSSPGPDDEVSFRDLYKEVASRLNETELKVLELYQSSPCSERKIAEGLNISRYAAGLALDKIKTLFHDLAC